MQILVIEDEPQIASFIRKGLEAENYQVQVCHTGEHGVETCRKRGFDLIILDLMLPDISGEAVCKRLRKMNVKTPILALTAKSNLEDKVKTLNLGADDYLTKPFAFEELLARIKALLRRTPDKFISHTLKIADLRLDSRTREVKRGGKSLKLTAKEFSLLEYLLHHPQRVLSRSELLQKVWGLNFDPSSNIVDVYIRYLRQKIDSGFKKKLIHTVQGVGYQIKV